MTSSVSVTLINMYFHHPSLNLASFAYFNIPFWYCLLVLNHITSYSCAANFIKSIRNYSGLLTLFNASPLVVLSRRSTRVLRAEQHHHG